MLDYIHLDYDSKEPKYLQIIDSIIHNISRGNFQIGDKIPSITKLSQEFYISRDTVERAYNVLKKRNVIVSVHGKGTYIADNRIELKPKIIFFTHKLSPCIMKVYDAFLDELGENVEVDLHSYHSDESLFLDLIEKHKSSFDFFVIMPHFRTENLEHISFTSKVNNALNTIPKENIIILDNNKHELKGNFIEVFQDFDNDIYNGLKCGTENIKKYKKLCIVYPRTTFYPYPRRILKGFLRYCADFNFDFEIVEEISSDHNINNGYLFITLEDEDLVNLVNGIKKKNLILGKDVGVISYNDTPLKQLLGISVLTTNFELMGNVAAKMILNNKKEIFKVPFNLIERISL